MTKEQPSVDADGCIFVDFEVLWAELAYAPREAMVSAQGRTGSAVVDLSAMRDAQNEDQEPVVLDRVDDAVVADPDPPPPRVATAEHLRPRGSGIDAEQLDRAHDA
jgi:hypothetical protein